MPIPSVLELGNATYALLDAHPDLLLYDSNVEPAPPLDEAGVIKGYAVFYPGIGDETPNNLARRPGQLLWSCQVTCVGGDRNYVSWVVDAVRSRLAGKTLVVAGTSIGTLAPPLGYSPPVLQNTQVQPPRLSVPLQYQLLSAA